MSDINFDIVPLTSCVVDDYFILHEIRMHSDTIIFVLHEEHVIEMTTEKASHFLEICRASTKFTIYSQFNNINYGDLLAAKITPNFFKWCKEVIMTGSYKGSFLKTIASTMNSFTNKIEVKTFSATDPFRLSNIISSRLQHLKSLSFDSRCTSDSDFASNIYEIIAAKICNLDYLFLKVTGFPTDNVSTMLHLIMAATSTGSTTIILTEELATDRNAEIVLNNHFGLGGAEMIRAASAPYPLQHYSTFVSYENDRTIYIGFLVAE
uniref:Uncharacterized protein n=1 Tax=Panagrolaimus sp. ES5 TaxID=591445 RepID=A0AC34FQM2_9BILA